MTSDLNLESIKSILTIRYDHTHNPTISKLNWKNFTENEIINPITDIENTIKDFYFKNIQNKKNVGVALSGGIDSTLLLTLLRKSFPKIPINTFSIRFSDSVDETGYAKKISEKLDSVHKIIEVDNYFEELPKAISIIKLPFWDLHWYYLTKVSSQISSTIVSGDGCDELFGGYTFRYNKFLSLVSDNSTIKEKIIAYLNCHERDWVPDQEKLFGDKMKFNWNEIHSIFEKYFNNSLSPLKQVYLSDFNGKLLFNWLLVNPRFNSYYKIKSITPFLDDKLTKIGTHLPNTMKYDFKQNIGKIILRKILKKYNMEKLVLDQKQGFSVNTINLWKNQGKKLCEQYLVEGEVVENGLINKEWILKHITKNDLDVRYVNKFFGLLAFEIWFRLFISKSMKSSEKITI